jgi:hypothetical protein
LSCPRDLLAYPPAAISPADEEAGMPSGVIVECGLARQSEMFNRAYAQTGGRLHLPCMHPMRYSPKARRALIDGRDESIKNR